MTSSEFVPIMPGAIDDLGAEHGLSWSARSMLLWLVVTADRTTGLLRPVTAYAISGDTGCSRKAVIRALDELIAVGAIKAHLPRGHEGEITVLWHDDIVWSKELRSRRSSTRSRRSSSGSRRSSTRSRSSTRANRENDSQKKKTSTADDAAPSGEASSSAGLVPCALLNGQICDGTWHTDGNGTAEPCPRKRPTA